MKIFVPILGAAVVCYLYYRQKISKRVLVAGLLGLFGCLVLTVMDLRSGELEQIRSLNKNSRENALEEIPLEAETEDGTRHEVKLKIPEESADPKVAANVLKKAVKDLEKLILGKNRDASHVEWNLNLPVSLENSQVSCVWSSDHPALLGWDGEIRIGVPAEGQDVLLKAQLELQGQTRSWEKKIRLYPSRDETAFQQKVQNEAEVLNGNSKTWKLPDSVDGEQIIWYRKRGGKGETLCLVILCLVLGSVLVREKRQEEKIRAHREELIRRYPEIVSELQLYTAAGLSLRQAMKRIARNEPEAERCCYEMENGVLEQDAYTRFGERCGTAEYRKLALLLAQSQMKGGARLSELLEEEAQGAFENRKRRARVLGEKAAVRMVLPMGMMLLIVLIIVMVPAFLTF